MLFKRKGRFTDNIGNHDSKKKNCQVLFEILLFVASLSCNQVLYVYRLKKPIKRNRKHVNAYVNQLLNVSNHV